jgi:BirA family biotin operon repressor/biotin-[acetyl-CoA-carboxylase] ligase
MNRKKICGILTEAETSVEAGGLDSIVIGIGINFRSDPEAFPEDVLGRVGWIYEKEEKSVARNELAAAVIDRTLYYADHLQEREFIEPYKEYSIILGKEIICTRGKERFEAIALDIDNNGALIVDTAEGRRVLSSGEITVRWKNMQS